MMNRLQMEEDVEVLIHKAATVAAPDQALQLAQAAAHAANALAILATAPPKD